jgi:hypothetical protein
VSTKGSGTVLSSGDVVDSFSAVPDDSPLSSTSSSTYENVGSGLVGFSDENVPDGVALYGKLVARADVPDGETGTLRYVASDDGASQALDEIELTIEGVSGSSFYETAFAEITFLSDNTTVVGERFDAKVTSGTLDFSERGQAVIFEWRVK